MRSYDASTATDLEPAALVLAELHRRALACGVEIMVVGATARDILIRHVTGAAPERRTADIDVAVAVSSWADLGALTRDFPSAREVHRFVVRSTAVDVIPFGEIEAPDRTVTWSNEHRMDVFGFREAWAAAVQVTLPGGLAVAVASLPAQSLLKLFAWRDRRYQDRRDAIDLKTIVSAYQEGPYFDELYTAHQELLVRHDFDPLLAGAERIGREARSLVASADRAIVTGVLGPALLAALAGDMGGRVDSNRALLAAYKNGFGPDS